MTTSSETLLHHTSLESMANLTLPVPATYSKKPIAKCLGKDTTDRNAKFVESMLHGRRKCVMFSKLMVDLLS